VGLLCATATQSNGMAANPLQVKRCDPKFFGPVTIVRGATRV